MHNYAHRHAINMRVGSDYRAWLILYYIIGAKRSRRSAAVGREKFKRRSIEGSAEGSAEAEFNFKWQ